MRVTWARLLWIPPAALLAWGVIVTLVDVDAGGLQWVSVFFGLVLYAVAVGAGLLLARLLRRRSRTP